jgi:uncharacterized protein (TIGR03083 family)
MDTEALLLTFDEHGDGIGGAATVLRANASACAADRRVPTCPDWTVLDLVAHQGMVHRWATDVLRGRRGVDPAAYESQGRATGDQLGWFDDGATALLQALVDAPDDLDALVFLHDAPPAKLFWARRQCHETTIHAVDAMAARLGRAPRPDETWIGDRQALDGIDELLVGFVARPRRGAVHTDAPTDLVVRPTGARIAWHVAFGPEVPAVTRRVTGTDPVSGAEHEISGDPVDLYLTLWNRTDPDGADEDRRWWRDLMRVTWS